MYCVKCGVKLQDGVTECPLCGTPVIIPGEELKERHETYSERYPKENMQMKFGILGFITTVMTAASLTLFLLCMNLYGRVSWSGYAMLGMALVWIMGVLPLWFRRPKPVVFIPIDIAAICGYLLYICLYNGGGWFLSFAFPVTLISGAILIGAVALFIYVRRGRLYIIGGLFIVIGASCMLIELFQHITFATPMFQWSLYCVTVFSAVGLFLIIAAIIPPLRDYMQRKFFI